MVFPPQLPLHTVIQENHLQTPRRVFTPVSLSNSPRAEEQEGLFP